MLAARIGMTGKLPWMMVSVASSKPKTAIASEGGERAERYSRNDPCETALSKSAINPCSRVAEASYSSICCNTLLNADATSIFVSHNSNARSELPVFNNGICRKSSRPTSICALDNENVKHVHSERANAAATTSAMRHEHQNLLPMGAGCYQPARNAQVRATPRYPTQAA